jgi:hypothetical protein
MTSYNALGWSGPLPLAVETLVRQSVGHTWNGPEALPIGVSAALLGGRAEVGA